MKYTALLSLVFLAGSFGQAPPSKAPEDATLPNGKRWADVIAEADYKDNVRDSRALANLTAQIRDDIEASDKFVLSLKTLRKVEDAEKLLKDMRARMRKN
jgi:hypothetical protein